VLDEELSKLPDAARAPLVLCYLEGRTRDQAAAELKLSLGTLKRRLERGREMLRERLARRGVALPAALLAVGAAEVALPARVVAAVPPLACALEPAPRVAALAARPPARGSPCARSGSSRCRPNRTSHRPRTPRRLPRKPKPNRTSTVWDARTGVQLWNYKATGRAKRFGFSGVAFSIGGAVWAASVNAGL
jgi:hypothetical protein